jgi:hypothetical protein
MLFYFGIHKKELTVVVYSFYVFFSFAPSLTTLVYSHMSRITFQRLAVQNLLKYVLSSQRYFVVAQSYFQTNRTLNSFLVPI